MATAALTLGIVSLCLILVPFMLFAPASFICGVLGIIFSSIIISNEKHKSDEEKDSKESEKAKAGLICSIIALSLLVVFSIFTFIFFLMAL